MVEPPAQARPRSRNTLTHFSSMIVPLHFTHTWGKTMGEEKGNPYSQRIAKAWTDEDFMTRLKADPKSAMNEVGMDAPEGVETEIVESTQGKAGRTPKTRR